MIGDIIGNYRVLKKLGEGGMGTVYLARDLSLEREVALKIISPELTRNPSLMARFRVEAIAQAKLNHSNITVIHSFDQQKDTYYIVMEFVDGKTLKQVVRENKKIPLKEAAAIFSQILEAVAYAHFKGIVHRDIKPSNIFLTKDHTVKIGDFGIAKVEGIDGLTRAGSTLGSPLYCSPEQVMGKKTDARTDVYSLGMTLYEMLTGKLPFKQEDDSDYKLMRQVLDIVPQTPSQLERSIPPAVDAFIMKCLAKTPEERFQSVKEAEETFKKIITPQAPPSVKIAPPVKTAKIVKPAASASIKTDRKKILIIAFSLSIVLVFIVIYLIVSTNTEPLPQPSTSTSPQVTQSTSSRPVNEFPRIIQPNPGTTSPTQPQPGTGGEPSSPAGTGGTGISTGTSQRPLAVNISDIPTRMDDSIRSGNFAKAVEIGEQAIKNGSISPDIYRKLALAYFYDGNKDKARKYYWKVAELKEAFHFNVYYEYRNDKKVSGTLSVSGSTLSFTPDNQNLVSLQFSIPLSQVKRVSADRISDFKGIFKKKKTREKPVLVIRDHRKQKYDIQLKRHDNKLRSFIMDIIETLGA